MEFDLSKRHCFYFHETTKIPHGSYNEKALSDYIVEFAKAHNLKYMQILPLISLLHLKDLTYQLIVQMTHNIV